MGRFFMAILRESNIKIWILAKLLLNYPGASHNHRVDHVEKIIYNHLSPACTGVGHTLRSA
jgi:hypothetical protein